MKTTMFRNLILGLVLALMLSVSAFAQTDLTTTTLAGAVTNNSQTTFSLTSVTGITANQSILFLTPGLEAADVTAVSGTFVTVRRGTQGTRAVTHAVNTVVWVANTPNRFTQQAPRGSCTRASSQDFSPMIHLPTGDLYNCNPQVTFAAVTAGNATATAAASGYWERANLGGFLPNLPYVNPTNAAFTASLAHTIIDFNSMTATRVLTLPSVTGIVGKVLIIKNNSGSGTADITVTAPNGQYISSPGTATLTVGDRAGANLISVGGGWNTF